MTAGLSGCPDVGRRVVLILLALLTGCGRTRVPARQILEYNVETVRDGKTERMLEHAFDVALMVLREPVWTGTAPGFDREELLAEKENWRAVFHKPLIRDWLVSLHEPGSDLAIVAVYEFRHYDELTDFLGVDPEADGIPVVEAVAQLRPELETAVWPAEMVAFLGLMGTRVFSSRVWPLIVRHHRRGEDPSGLRLLEEAGVVDRWAVAYLSSRGVLFGVLMLRARGRWALWPLVH